MIIQMAQLKLNLNCLEISISFSRLIYIPPKEEKVDPYLKGVEVLLPLRDEEV